MLYKSEMIQALFLSTGRLFTAQRYMMMGREKIAPINKTLRRAEKNIAAFRPDTIIFQGGRTGGRIKTDGIHDFLQYRLLAGIDFTGIGL